MPNVVQRSPVKQAKGAIEKYLVSGTPLKRSRSDLDSVNESEQPDDVIQDPAFKTEAAAEIAQWLKPKLEKLDILVAMIKELNTHKQKVVVLEQQVKQLEKTVRDQELKLQATTRALDQVTDEVRKDNLIVHGISEEVTDRHLQGIIGQLFYDDLGIDAKFEDPFRLGRRGDGKNRPVKIRMSTSADKLTVLSNKRYLPSSVKITEDLSLSSRVRKQEIWQRKFGTRSSRVLPPTSFTTLPTSTNRSTSVAPHSSSQVPSSNLSFPASNTIGTQVINNTTLDDQQDTMETNA